MPHEVRWPYRHLGEFCGGGSSTEVAVRVGRTTRTVERWRTAGLTLDAADRAACALGVHPSAIWPDWYDTEEVA